MKTKKSILWIALLCATNMWATTSANTSQNVTVRAKMPADWGTIISAWVWGNNSSGEWATLTKDGEWYVYQGIEYNIIFVNGTNWTTSDNQTEDISITADMCIQVGYSTGWTRSYSIVNCDSATPTGKMPTDISQYTSQGISHAWSNEDQFDIEVLYLAYQNGTASWPMNCIQFYGPNGQIYNLNASDLFDSSLSGNGLFVSYMTQKDGYTFIDLQSKESGTWHLKLVQEYAGNWMYYYTEQGSDSIKSGKCGDNVYWTLNLNSKTLVITGDGNMYDYNDIDELPWYEYRESINQAIVNQGVTSIGSHAFDMYNSLISVTLPDGLLKIGWGAFAETYITNIVLPTSLQTIEQDAFLNCTKLKSIKIEEGLTTIPNGMVYNCSSLEYIDIPSTVTTIGDDFLGYCTGLQYVICRAKNPPSVSTWAALQGIDTSIPLYVSGSSISAYRNATVWEEFTNILSFTPQYNITTIASPSFGGTISGGGACYEGNVTLLATPNTGYHFTQWSDGNTNNQRVIYVVGDATYSAMFEPNSYSVSTAAQNGYIIGSGTYAYNDKCVLTAIPNEHYHFTQWSDGNKNNPRTITVVGDATYSVTFDIDRHSISATAQNGSVTGGGTYNYGSKISLIATANYGYHFVRWSDGNTSNPRSITVTQNATYQAICEANEYTISTTAQNGSVIGSGTYLYNKTCTLTAIPNEHYHFVQWSDGIIANPRTITVIDNASYTAIFEINKYTINVESENYNIGWVTNGGTYDALSTVLVMAAASSKGYEWDRWSDGVTLAGRSIVLTSDTTIVAQFAMKGTDDCVEVDVNDPLLGNAEIQVIAIPKNNAIFNSWSDGNTDNPRTVTNAPMLYTAIFASSVPTKIDNVSEKSDNDTSNVRKIILDNTLFIIRDGKTYNAQGAVVE